MTEIDAGRLTLRPIELETARALLSGQTPAELVLASDYPSQFCCARSSFGSTTLGA